MTEGSISDEEYKSLGEALKNAKAAKVWPDAIAVCQFLALTGWRSGEALNLRWEQVDLQRRMATLTDTKTGHSMRPLSLAACTVLTGLPRRKGKDLVFQATRGDGSMTGFPKLWAKITAHADTKNDVRKKGKKTKVTDVERKLPKDITPHVLRHSFASLAADLGYSELAIAALIGHKGQSVTSRYVHSADAVQLAVADAVANRTAALMGDEMFHADVIPLKRVAG